MALSNLGGRLAEVGRHEEAMEPTKEAVGLYRALAEENPAAHLPILARVLWGFAWARVAGALAVIEESVRIHRGLAARLPVAGALELNEALAAIKESVRIYRGLAGCLPEAFAADLRRALSTQAVALDVLRLLEHPASDEPT
jgi:hypothetical protein